MNKKSTHFTDAGLQKLVIASFIVSMLGSISMQVYYAVLQLPHNTNLSGFMLPMIWLILPLLYVAIAYAMQTGKMTRTNKLFDALVITAIIVVLQSGLSMGLQPVFQFLSINNGEFWSYLLFELGISTIVALLMILLLVRLRRTKRW